MPSVFADDVRRAGDNFEIFKVVESYHFFCNTIRSIKFRILKARQVQLSFTVKISLAMNLKIQCNWYQTDIYG